MRLTRGRWAMSAWTALALVLAAGSLLATIRGGFGSLPPGPETVHAFTAAWMHLDARHLGANLAGCVAVAVLGAAARLPAAAALAWLLAWPLTHVLARSFLAPGAVQPVGASGVLHAGVAVAVIFLVAAHKLRWIGLLLGLGLLAKIAIEAPWREPVRAMPGWGFGVAVILHATGVAAGLATGLMARAALGMHARPRGAPEGRAP